MEGGSGEDEEDTDEAWEILLEAETFSWRPLGGRGVLKETHRRWVRDLNLSVENLIWVGEVLLKKSKDFRKSKRKETRWFDGIAVSLIEGRNYWGSFISLQVSQGSAEPKFVVILAGVDGRQWGRLAAWIKDQFSPGKSGVGGSSVRLSGSGSNSASIAPRSYADVLRIDRVADTETLENEIVYLKSKLDSMLEEVVLLRSAFASFMVGRNGVSGSEPVINLESGGVQSVDTSPCSLVGVEGITV